jgi:hypothetical protein
MFLGQLTKIDSAPRLMLAVYEQQAMILLPEMALQCLLTPWELETV